VVLNGEDELRSLRLVEEAFTSDCSTETWDAVVAVYFALEFIVVRELLF
jgi:hypothetical protein